MSQHPGCQSTSSTTAGGLAIGAAARRAAGLFHGFSHLTRTAPPHVQHSSTAAGSWGTRSVKRIARTAGLLQALLPRPDPSRAICPITGTKHAGSSVETTTGKSDRSAKPHDHAPAYAAHHHDGPEAGGRLAYPLHHRQLVGGGQLHDARRASSPCAGTPDLAGPALGPAIYGVLLAPSAGPAARAAGIRHA